MHAHTPLPVPPFAPGPRVIVLEAPAGRARRAAVEAWAAAARGEGEAWTVECDAERGGMWAGVDAWVEALLPALEAGDPALFVRHDQELTTVLPQLRMRVRPRFVNLTEASEGDEAIRTYAADRAFRINHGLVEMLEAWHARSGGGRWSLACDGFGRRSAMAADFFRQLLRRRGHALGLVLLAAVDPGEGDAVAAELAPFAPVERVSLALEAGPEARVDPDEAARKAEETEAWARQDTLTVRMHGHELIALWTAAGRPERALRWHAWLLGVLTQMGFYRDALRHAAPVHADLAATGEREDRVRLVNKLQAVYLTTDLPDEARRVVEEEGLAKVEDAAERARLLYMLAMLHARHLPARDMEAGERLLREAVAEAERADLSDADRHFLTGFLLNGLAYVRFRQGDAREAAALSRANHERLESHLPPERHRLHRSVLLYNAGQVYAQAGEHEAALAHFTQAMEMDPHYAEYHNDRGNVLMKLGRHAEAEADYLRALELSPPFPEAWFNLGQARARLGKTAEAEAAYARAVDLDPSRPEAWGSLGVVRASLGRREEAVAAYDASLALDAASPFVLANRAALRFELGRAEEALADLDRALALAPGHPALERNRARVAQALAQAAAAAPEPALR